MGRASSKMSKYEKLDCMLLAGVKSGLTTFAQLQRSDILAEADAIATPNRYGDGEGWRVIDRRLQALRKAGKIRFTSKCWVYCEETK